MTSFEKRFKVALSFPGETRKFVGQVAEVLARQLGQRRILYDQFLEAEFAKPGLDEYLQRLYHDEADLIAVFLCADYERKEWCGLEWRAIRDLIKQRRSDAIMLLRFDDAKVSGIFSTDGYIWIGRRSPQEIAELILGRLDQDAKRDDATCPSRSLEPGPPPAERPPRARLASAPPMPALFLGRAQEVRDITDRLAILSESLERKATHGLMAIRGWPGAGKTTLATAIADDDAIARAFPDGHLWASLGTRPDLFSELDAWARSLGVTDLLQESNLAAASRRLAALMRGRRLLLIIDDVWQMQHAKALIVGDSGSATLITTRITSVAHALALPENIRVLGRLCESASLELLGCLAPGLPQKFPSECCDLVNELEGLPLALNVAGRLLHAEASRGWDVRDLLADIRQSSLLLQQQAPADMTDLVTQTTPTIAALLKKSTDVLDEPSQERFALLGVVKEKPASFDLEFMKAQWRVNDARPTANLLIDRGLLEPVGNQRFQMHSLLVSLAASMLEA